MKKVEAILKPSKLDEDAAASKPLRADVKDALSADGAQGMTVIDLKGFGTTTEVDQAPLAAAEKRTHVRLTATDALNVAALDRVRRLLIMPKRSAFPVGM